MWDEMAPCVWGPVSISAIEDGDEVGFECLYGSFCKVPSVHVGVDQLAVKVLGFDTGDEVVGDFIVQAVKDWFDSCINEALVACIIPFDEVFGSTALDRFS